MSPFNWAHRVLINPSTGPKRVEQETLQSQEREKEEDFNREVTDLVHTWLWGQAHERGKQQPLVGPYGDEKHGFSLNSSFMISMRPLCTSAQLSLCQADDSLQIYNSLGKDCTTRSTAKSAKTVSGADTHKVLFMCFLH